jgi:hypothetical protein
MTTVIHHEGRSQIPKRHVDFYTKYASAVFKSLKKPFFQKFLGWMLTRENIEEQDVEMVQIRIFPFKKKDGKFLRGRCLIRRREIRIYPKRFESLRDLVHKFGKKGIVSYAKDRAKATLIHELLHLKYAGDEDKVKKLTQKYFTIFDRRRNSEKSYTSAVSRMLFKE